MKIFPLIVCFLLSCAMPAQAIDLIDVYKPGVTRQQALDFGATAREDNSMFHSLRINGIKWEAELFFDADTAHSVILSTGLNIPQLITTLDKLEEQSFFPLEMITHNGKEVATKFYEDAHVKKRPVEIKTFFRSELLRVREGDHDMTLILAPQRIIRAMRTDDDLSSIVERHGSAPVYIIYADRKAGVSIASSTFILVAYL